VDTERQIKIDFVLNGSGLWFSLLLGVIVRHIRAARITNNGELSFAKLWGLYNWLQHYNVCFYKKATLDSHLVSFFPFFLPSFLAYFPTFLLSYFPTFLLQGAQQFSLLKFLDFSRTFPCRILIFQFTICSNAQNFVKKNDIIHVFSINNVNSIYSNNNRTFYFTIRY